MPKKNNKKISKPAPRDLKKTPKANRKLAHKPAKRLPKKALSASGLLIYIAVGLMLFSLWYALRSAELASKSYMQAARNASSILAYDESQIRTAKVVGPDKQLKNEIINYQKAPQDLQNYVLNDYRNLKKNCVVNGDLVGQSYYKIISVAYSGFATISKGCNGQETNVLAKMSGHWATVFSGNDLITCSLVNDYDIPQFISRNCQTNGTLFLNPNP